MTTIREWQDAPLNESDGAQFLEAFDRALNGREVSGPHAEAAEFGGELSRCLSRTGDRAAETEAKIRAALGAAPPRPSRIRETTVERRFGVLNLAALAAFLLLSAAVGWTWWNRKPYVTPARRSVAAEDAPAPPKKPNAAPLKPELTFDQRLARPITFDFTGLKLEAALAKCRELGQIEIVTDPKLNAAPTDLFAIFNVKDMELRNVLSWIAAQWHTEYTAKGDKIYLGNSSDVVLSLGVYDVADMGVPAPVIAAIIKAALMQDFAIPATSLEENNGKIVAMQTATVHQKIKRILRYLRSHAQDHEFSFRLEPVEEEWKKDLDARLSKHVSFEHKGKLLLQVLTELQAVTAASLVVNANVNSDTPIWLQVTDMKASNALDWISRLSDVQNKMRYGAVYVSAPEPEPLGLEFRVFNVADLVTNSKLSATDMAMVIRTRIKPESWDAAVGASVTVDGHFLLVWQTAAIQDLISEVLRNFRTPPERIDEPRHEIHHESPPTQVKDPIDAQKTKGE